MTLYEISNEYEVFLNLVETGEIPEEAISDTLESIQDEFEQKADNVACIIKNLVAESEALKQERTKLEEREKTKRNQAERLKHYLSGQMQRLGKNKIESARNVISFRKSTRLQIEDEELFKAKHLDLCNKEIKITIPKAEITKLIKSGEEISGAALIENKNLTIK